MVLDTSAVVAILQSEPDSERLVDALAAADTRRMSAANVLETALVMQSRYGDFSISTLLDPPSGGSVRESIRLN